MKKIPQSAESFFFWGEGNYTISYIEWMRYHSSQPPRSKKNEKTAETKSTGRPEELRTNGQRHRNACGSGNDIINTDIGGTNTTTLSPELEVRESHDILHDFRQHLYQRRGQLINITAIISNQTNDNSHTPRQRIRNDGHSSELQPKRTATTAQSTN